MDELGIISVRRGTLRQSNAHPLLCFSPFLFFFLLRRVWEWMLECTVRMRFEEEVVSSLSPLSFFFFSLSFACLAADGLELSNEQEECWTFRDVMYACRVRLVCFFSPLPLFFFFFFFSPPWPVSAKEGSASGRLRKWAGSPFLFLFFFLICGRSLLGLACGSKGEGIGSCRRSPRCHVNGFLAAALLLLFSFFFFFSPLPLVATWDTWKRWFATSSARPDWANFQWSNLFLFFFFLHTGLRTINRTSRSHGHG